MKLTLLVLRCSNIDTTKDFYAALGLEFTKEQHNSGPEHYSAHLGELVLELYPASNGEVDSSRLGLELPRLSNLLDSLDILKEYEYNSTKVRIVVDPDGRKVELYEGAP